MEDSCPPVWYVSICYMQLMYFMAGYKKCLREFIESLVIQLGIPQDLAHTPVHKRPAYAQLDYYKSATHCLKVENSQLQAKLHTAEQQITKLAAENDRLKSTQQQLHKLQHGGMHLNVIGHIDEL